MGVIVEGNIIDRVWRLGPTAESLGISKKTLQRLVARGAITTVQISDRIKGITESELRRFIESRTGGA
jgi:predicted site-specific integrase-resolvase